MSGNSIKKSYEKLVTLNYQLYNGLFLTLPLNAVEQAGLLLPLLEEACEEGMRQGNSPKRIIEDFLESHRAGLNEGQKIDFLFKVIQYVERQIVLVDALEDAAFSKIHQTRQRDHLRKLIDRASADRLTPELEQLANTFRARVILTAHPTQFYPGPVLAIIADLTKAIQDKDIPWARTLLQQLGNTPFFNKEKPTPLDEAVNLSWYLGNIFYPTISKITDKLVDSFPELATINPELLSVGFWPGGDRDGNPFVNPEITKAVMAKLRSLVIACYHAEIRELKRRMSFQGVYDRLESIEHRLYAELVHERGHAFASKESLIEELRDIENLVNEQFQGLFLDRLQTLIRRVQTFGFHFASLDIRQDSRVLQRVYEQVSASSPGRLPDVDRNTPAETVSSLLAFRGEVDAADAGDPLVLDTLGSMALIEQAQAQNGELACHRYVISNCRDATDVARVMALFRAAGWKKDELTVDIVPLFETVQDLEGAGDIMALLYADASYRKHLHHRHFKQTVMLGFSDGTKDGGYLMANWAIFRAKENITTVSRAAGVEVSFFDGRGGPPARGGGNTYRFYAALGKTIESNQIQQTVQGQTISSYYGTRDAAGHNLRQLLAAGLENNLYQRPERELSDEQRALIDQLAAISYQKYQAFKSHPKFLPYLERMSALHFYAQSNIGSRPSKRGGDSELRFEDLRAIPFVGAWGQLKQNVPGYYGLGSALKALEEQGRLEECAALYRDSNFFKALLDNSMQSMSKANFQLTAYMAEHPEFGEFWQGILEEFELSKEMVLKASGQEVLLADNPVSRLSIALRQKVVLPSLIIQQYAFMRLEELRGGEAQDVSASQLAELEEVYEKMIVRCMFGNINASRNSA